MTHVERTLIRCQNQAIQQNDFVTRVYALQTEYRGFGLP